MAYIKNFRINKKKHQWNEKYNYGKVPMNLNLSQTYSEQQGHGTLFKVAALAKAIPQGMDCTGIHRVDRQLAEPSALLTVRCFSCDYRRWYERCKSNYFRKWKHKRFHFSSWHPNDILSEPAKPSTSSSA